MIQTIRTIGNPVFSLQSMLRTISFQYPVIPRLVPDGLFGERTLEAVMVFQREFFPPVTGRVDLATWNAIAALYQKALQALRAPRSAHLFPHRDFTLTPGQSSVHLAPIQSMFNGLSRVLDGLEPCSANGQCDSATEHNVRWLQHVSQQAETGTLDKGAWDTLERLYALFLLSAGAPGVTRAHTLSNTGV